MHYIKWHVYELRHDHNVEAGYACNDNALCGNPNSSISGEPEIMCNNHIQPIYMREVVRKLGFDCLYSSLPGETVLGISTSDWQTISTLPESAASVRVLVILPGLLVSNPKI